MFYYAVLFFALRLRRHLCSNFGSGRRVAGPCLVAAPSLTRVHWYVGVGVGGGGGAVVSLARPP